MTEPQVVSRLKVKQIRSRRHLEFVSFCGCVVPGCRWHYTLDSAVRALHQCGITAVAPNPYVTWHHVRRSNNSGTAIKPPDTACVGVCVAHHLDIHQGGEKTCSARWGIDLMECANELAAASRALGILPPE